MHKVTQITHGPKHHFFGYYDKWQWDESQRYLLTLEVDFADRSPRPTDVAQVCLIDVQDNCQLHPISKTRAWCWQQGSMLQWVPGSPRTIVHNDLIGDRFVSVFVDIDTGARRVLPRPIYTISHDGRYALSLNFARLAVTRPGYGYNGLIDQWNDELHPAEDGIYLMDLATGEHRLIVSIDQLARSNPEASMAGVKHWVNHLLFSPDGKRFIFLHRWDNQKGLFHTRLYTASLDGSELFCSRLQRGSHFIWYDNTRILIWGYTEDQGYGYYLIEDQTDHMELVGKGVLTRDGHCNFAPGSDWFVTDEYPDANNMRPLILYHLREKTHRVLERFYSPPEKKGELRCDLHPRWSRDGRYICIDTFCEGTRQMCLVDVGAIIEGSS